MDAKLTPEQAIKTIDLKQAKEMMLILVDTDGNVETVGTSYLKQFFEYVESLSREAELGRTVVEAINGHPAKFTMTICLKLPPEITEKYCGSPVCMWHNFCRLRAEIDRLQRKGAE